MTPPDVVDLMAALEASLAELKEAQAKRVAASAPPSDTADEPKR